MGDLCQNKRKSWRLQLLTLWDVEAVLDVSSGKRKVHQTNVSIMFLRLKTVNFWDLTYWGADSQCDAVPTLLDQVDDVPVVQGVDVHVVHRQDPVSHLKSPTTFCRRTWNIFSFYVCCDSEKICRIELLANILGCSSLRNAFLFSDTNKVPGEIVVNISGMKTNPFRERLTSVTRHFTSDNEAEEQHFKNHLELFFRWSIQPD